LNSLSVIHLDIVQPCYNPLPDWEKSVVEHFAEVKRLLPDINIRLIIVNDGSLKNITLDRVSFLKTHIKNFVFVDNQKNNGKGHTLRTGISVADARVVIYTDIDFPYELIHIKEIYDLISSGKADVISGVRKQNYYQKLSPQRWLASKMSQILNHVFLKLPFNDTQSGIKGINRKARVIFMRTTIKRYLADTEFLALAAKTKKLKMLPLEVSLRDNIVLSKMSFKTFLREFRNFITVYSIVFKRKV
jgi:glycosyltransferase involved in cell wall biosynthesis